MMPPRIVSDRGELVANSSNYELGYLLPWMLMYGGSHLDTALTLSALESSLGARLFWRTADVLTDDPNGWQTPGTVRTTNNIHPESFDLSGQTSSLYVQCAVGSALTSGTALKRAMSAVHASVRGAGWLVARERLVLRPSSSATVLAVGTPFPCANVTGLMVGLVFYGLSGTIVSPPPSIARLTPATLSSPMPGPPTSPGPTSRPTGPRTSCSARSWVP